MSEVYVGSATGDVLWEKIREKLQGKNYRGVATTPLGCIRVNGIGLPPSVYSAYYKV